MRIKMKKRTLIENTFILSVAGLIAKIISEFFKVPLGNLTGTIGLNYYQSAFAIYSLLTAASLIGIPNSVSKLIAEEVAKNKYKKHILFFELPL